MSDINDLIHRNAQLAFEQGVKTERERIIKLLETEFEKGNEHICQNCDTWLEIKGEQK